MVHSTYLYLTASDSRNQTRFEEINYIDFGTFRVASRNLPFCYTLHKKLHEHYEKQVQCIPEQKAE